MKSAFIALVSVALAAGAYAQSLTINTPSNAVVCQPLQITWTGGQGPWFLSVLPGADPSGAALEDFGQQNASPFTWQAVNFPQGTSLGLTLRDSQGNTAQSAPFTVNPGSDTGCLNASGSSSGSASASASASASGSSSGSSASASTTSAGASTSASAGSSSASPSATSHASSPSASSSGGASTSASTSPSATAGGNDASGAVANAASLGAAAVVGGIVLAVLA